VSSGSDREAIEETALEESICIHIFSGSAAMLGVCLTVIGILRLVSQLSKVNTMGDDLLALAALGFLCSSLFSYVALRSRERRRRIERVADAVFLGSLCLMAVVCGLIVYAFV
jgi:hypothetical protein